MLGGKVSQQLGHASPQITMKINAKWIPQKGQREAMNSLPSLSCHDSSPAEKVAG
jgi:integrase